jgi:anti-sigma factor RsiW
VQHCTPEQLALAALREPLPADDAAHLAGCERCRAEVASLQRAVDAVAVPQLAAPGPSVPPPPRVWEAIAAATGVSATPSSVPAPEDPPAAAEDPPAQVAEVLPFRSRRRPVLLVAAALVAGAAVGAGAVAVLSDRDDDGEAVTAVALDPLADNDASGQAEVVVRDDGTRVVEVDLDAPALDDGYYELWLIDREVVGMVPLGVVSPGSQTFELPADLDLGQFPLVDVSVEPLDGDPTHSGVSVARGELDS